MVKKIRSPGAGPDRDTRFPLKNAHSTALTMLPPLPALPGSLCCLQQLL